MVFRFFFDMLNFFHVLHFYCPQFFGGVFFSIFSPFVSILYMYEYECTGNKEGNQRDNGDTVFKCGFSTNQHRRAAFILCLDNRNSIINRITKKNWEEYEKCFNILLYEIVLLVVIVFLCVTSLCGGSNLKMNILFLLSLLNHGNICYFNAKPQFSIAIHYIIWIFCRDNNIESYIFFYILYGCLIVRLSRWWLRFCNKIYYMKMIKSILWYL